MSERCCGDLLPFSHKRLVRLGTDVGPIRPSSQLAFQFISKVFDGVEVRALCRPVKFFHTDQTMLKQEGLSQNVATKLEAQNRLECHCML
jgi:hypothetical protein